MNCKVGVGCIVVASLLVSTLAKAARADEAAVTVGRVSDERFAAPPEESRPIASDEPGSREGRGEPPELNRAPFRVSLGPVGVTTGRGLGLGLGLAADFGRGTVGFRLAGAWTRSEAGATSGGAIGDGLGQYTGEVTLDLHKRGPWHPIVGVGVGLAHVAKGEGSGNAGIGTARLGIEYAIDVEDADVRLGAGVTGALTGPTEREVADLRGYGVLGVGLVIGF